MSTLYLYPFPGSAGVVIIVLCVCALMLLMFRMGMRYRRQSTRERIVRDEQNSGSGENGTHAGPFTARGGHEVARSIRAARFHQK